MISAESFIRKAKAFGFGSYTGVPCSFLKPFINYIIDSDDVDYIPAPNEGDAIAIAGGAYLAGDQPIVMLQNSGLGNTVNPITSLLQTFNIPCLIIITLRGDPEAKPDEPQHQLMGKITQELIELMELNYSFFPENETDLDHVLKKASSSIINEKKSYVLIMRKGTVEPYALKGKSSSKVHSFSKPIKMDTSDEFFTRSQILSEIIQNTNKQDLIVATTGYTGRELAALDDRSNHFYMVGSMGCAASIGLGVALNKTDSRVIVIDGDGGLLMHLGALSTIGFEQPKNLIHILLDNQEYESTGGQDTASNNVDFAQIASSCGYEKSLILQKKNDLITILKSQQKQLTFIYMPIVSGVAKDLPRPRVAPHDVASRFKDHISQLNND